MILKFDNITNMYLFSIMSSLDDVFEASPGYFQYVNERAAHVKIDHVSIGVNLGHSKSLISLVVGWFSTTGVL